MAESSWKFIQEEDEAEASGSGAGGKSFRWAASEYIDHKQGFSWFAALTASTVALGAVIYLLTRDYFAVAIIALLGLAVGLSAKKTPRRLNYELDSKGLTIDKKQYPFSTFKSFAIIQDGALLSLDLEPVKRFMPPVTVYFEPADHEKIIQMLEDHLPYQERQLDFADRLSRRLRF